MSELIRPFLVCACVALFATVGLADGGFDACLGMFPNQAPPQLTDDADIDLCKTADGRAVFAVRFDTQRQTPDWVAYALTPEMIEGLTKRERPRFRPDPALPAPAQATDGSYVKSGYSRGHVAPAHDMSWNEAAYDATFDLSNVVPQRQRFNAGTWLGLENAVREWAKQSKTTLWTITGVYGANAAQPTIGKEPHTPSVPTCFFKIIAARDKDDDDAHRVLAVVLRFDDTRKRKAWVTGLTTLERIRARSGVPFLDGVNIKPGFDRAFWGVDMPAQPADCL